MIGQLGHIGYLIPWVYHFLSQLQSLRSHAGKHRQIRINDKCIKDLDLMRVVLDKAKNRVDMNLLTFWSPDQVYYLDSCPTGLGWYSNHGQVWRFKVPDEHLFKALKYLLKFLAMIITPWIDIIEGHLSAEDCMLNMKYSMMAEGLI